MLSDRERSLLINIIKHCDKILEKTKDLSKEEFEANEDI